MDPIRANSWKHRLLTAFVVFHLLSIVASVFKGTEPGAQLRSLTKDYERALGIWQAWGMFSPEPPKASSAFRATGVTLGGQEVDLPVLAGSQAGPQFRAFYDRNLKLERSALNPNSKKALRRGYGQWLCTRSTAEGLPLTKVALWKERVRHVRPQRRSTEGAVPGEAQRVELQTVSCQEDSP